MLLLATACGGLAESWPPSADEPGPVIDLEPNAGCESGGCSEPLAPEPPSAPEPTPGRVCDVATPSASLIVNEQSELDALEGCERIAGSLTLRVFAGMNGAPLRALRRVDGSLRIDAGRAPAERSLEAFSALEEVNSLLIDGTQEASLAGLARLRRVGIDAGLGDSRGRILIRNATALSSLQGLDALDTLELLELRDNPALASVAGIERVRELRRLVVTNSPLQSLTGVAALGVSELFLLGTQLRDLGGLGAAPRLSVLALNENPRLESLQGAQLPERLATVRLLENARLSDLRGLEAVREVGELLLAVAGGPAELASLAGLESLERVRSLTLRGLPLLGSLRGLEALGEVEELSLQGLGSLASLQGLSGLQRAGRISIEAALGSLAGLASPNINTLELSQSDVRSLAGLESATVSEALRLGNLAQLTSLVGLPTLDAAAVVHLFNLPALTDIEAVRGTTALRELVLSNTAVSNLDAFAELRQLSGLELSGNPQLTQLDGLAGLTQLRSLFIWQNPELRSLPVFAALEDVPCTGCAEELALQVSENPNLQTGPGLPLLERAQSIAITSNARLGSLDGLASLRAVSFMSVELNPSLRTLALPELSRSEDLRIRYNHALDDTPLEPLRSLPGARLVKIVSNAPGPAGLSPCPWPGDSECDEYNGDCAAGTDASDCSGLLY